MFLGRMEGEMNEDVFPVFITGLLCERKGEGRNGKRFIMIATVITLIIPIQTKPIFGA